MKWSHSKQLKFVYAVAAVTHFRRRHGVAQHTKKKYHTHMHARTRTYILNGKPNIKAKQFCTLANNVCWSSSHAPADKLKYAIVDRVYCMHSFEIISKTHASYAFFLWVNPDASKHLDWRSQKYACEQDKCGQMCIRNKQKNSEP